MKYPKSCDLCEKEISDSKEMLKHMKSHSYTRDLNAYYLQYIYECEDCDFKSKTTETMESWKYTRESAVQKCFQCGIYENTFGTVDQLDLHLLNCEVYKCQECQFRTKFLKDVKIHIETEHGQKKYLCHLKMDRNESDVVDIKQYRSDKV